MNKRNKHNIEYIITQIILRKFVDDTTIATWFE